jgi:nucleotide-binding universal stress UspA family protein
VSHFIDRFRFLGVIKKAAEEAGVRCDTDYVTSNHPYEMIIQAAEKKGCDLIMMASHGRRGVQGLLIGSETQKVLTHTRVPVLVLR